MIFTRILCKKRIVHLPKYNGHCSGMKFSKGAHKSCRNILLLVVKTIILKVKWNLFFFKGGNLRLMSPVEILTNGIINISFYSLWFGPTSPHRHRLIVGPDSLFYVEEYIFYYVYSIIIINKYISLISYIYWRVQPYIYIFLLN